MIYSTNQDGSITGAIERCAELHRALSARARLEIVLLLAATPMSVRDLARRTGLERSLISHHLRHLRDAGLIACTQSGHLRVYRLFEGAAITVSADRVVVDVGDNGVSVTSALRRIPARPAEVELKPGQPSRSDPGAPRDV